MRRTNAITPEEPLRVYWTKVSIDDGGVMTVGQLTSSIAREINQPVARMQALRGCDAPFTRHEREVLTLLAFTPERTESGAF
jgi:hypothetical protein